MQGSNFQHGTEMLGEVVQSEPNLFDAEELGYILRYHTKLSGAHRHIL